MTLLDRGTGPHPDGTQIHVRNIQTVMCLALPLATGQQGPCHDPRTLQYSAVVATHNGQSGTSAPEEWHRWHLRTIIPGTWPSRLACGGHADSTLTMAEPYSRISASTRDRTRRSARRPACRSEEHTSELQSRTLISYAVFCL